MSNVSQVTATPQNPELFKGIALFTPGGDLVYCIDPSKRSRWHLQLCYVLQETLGLPEPPHFLVPCYTATVDRWRDPHTQIIHTRAEAALPVLKYQALLNAIFDTGELIWEPMLVQHDLCSSIALGNYRSQFPQLWEEHDLVIRADQLNQTGRSPAASIAVVKQPVAPAPQPHGTVLRLFVSGSSIATQQIMQTLHTLLERSLREPYTLKVIDVRNHPDLAEADRVSATPTLVRVWPLPVRRIVGNLSDTSRILDILGGIDDSEKD